LPAPARCLARQTSSDATSITENQDALLAFPAGVTIVTSRNSSGEPVGATVSPSMAPSLDPPLVLVSHDRESRTGAALVDSGAFVVHFVGEATAPIARRFVRRCPILKPA
jgi:flavin reductase (DIM6/NTAB) family NADH-FMN oxidoreductase RutF